MVRGTRSYNNGNTGPTGKGGQDPALLRLPPPPSRYPSVAISLPSYLH